MPNKIVDTFAEAFDGVYARVLITADDSKTLRRAAMDVASSPSGPIGTTEAGVEEWVSKDETPDGRVGVMIQVWSGLEEGKPFGAILKKFEKEFSYRIRQNVLVKPLRLSLMPIRALKARLMLWRELDIAVMGMNGKSIAMDTG